MRDLEDLTGGKSKVQPGYMGNTKVSTIKHGGGKGATLDYKEEREVKKKANPIYLMGDAKPNYLANTITKNIHIGKDEQLKDTKRLIDPENTKTTVKRLVKDGKSIRPLDMTVIKEEDQSNQISERDIV